MMYAFFNKLHIPVAKLSGLETLMPTMNPGEKIYKYAEAFNTCGKIMSNMITNLKLFYELKNDIYDINYEGVILTTEIQNIWNDFIKNFNINYLCNDSCEIDCELLIYKENPKDIVHLDVNLFRIIISSLIENAYIYTHEGGISLSITSYKSEEDKTYTMELTVEDTGEGISGTYIDDVFEPFMKCSKNSIGPGLGLPIVKAACQKMNGDVVILKSEGGAKFQATFDYKILTSNPKLSSIDTRITNVKNKKDNDNNFQLKLLRKSQEQRSLRLESVKSIKRILLVEDSKITRMLLNSFLRVDKFDVIYASSGKEAIEKCKESQYDVIMMDINMPEMNGFTAINRIKEQCHLNFLTPVVVMSGTNIDDVGFLHHTDSVIHFLTKPITRDILIRVLSKYTDP